MPYNTTAIPPRRELSGQAQLPLARVKKILALDQDIAMCSNNAAFVITLATEMFVQYMAEQGHNVVKAERKPRRNIQYRDLANAVARLESLEFLVDIVPRTETYKVVKARRPKENTAPAPVDEAATNGDDSTRSSNELDSGQTTLAVGKPTSPVVNESNGIEAPVDRDDDETVDGEDIGHGAEDPDAHLRTGIRARRSTSAGTDEDVVMS